MLTTYGKLVSEPKAYDPCCQPNFSTPERGISYPINKPTKKKTRMRRACLWPAAAQAVVEPAPSLLAKLWLMFSSKARCSRSITASHSSALLRPATSAAIRRAQFMSCRVRLWIFQTLCFLPWRALGIGRAIPVL
jgi:hypothetical protein